MMNKILRILIVFCLSLMLGFPPPCFAQEAATDVGPYKISLDIKGMDVVDALKMLSARGGMDIVIGKNVSGRVTLFLKNVDVWQAFEIMLSANELAYEKQGNIINVMTQKDYELKYGERYEDKKQVEIVPLKYAKAVDLSRALAQLKGNLGKIVADESSNTLAIIDTPEKIKEMKEFIKNADLPLETKVFNLSYAQADKLQPKIQELLTKGVGNIKIEERINKIVVTDYPQRLAEISNIISAFDEKPQQVLIDAQIIQLTPSDLFEMGVNWDYWIKKYFDMKLALPVGTANRLVFGTPNNDPTKPGQYKAIVDVLRTIGDTKVLASPRITVLNNQEAKIHVGSREAYITSTTSQSGSGTSVVSQSVNFVDVGTQLYVTPAINRDGFITMKIKPEISTSKLTKILSEGQQSEIPIVTTSEAETTLIVKDGVTIIIGGLKKDNRDKTVKKVPILGDIPGLGLLFRSTSDNITQSDLVILLTPHIMSGEKAYVDFAEVKPKEGAVVKMVSGEIITEKISLPKPDKVAEAVKNKIPEEKISEDSLAELGRQYYRSIITRIRALSSVYKPSDKQGKVEVFFTLDSGGRLRNIPVILASTNQDLNSAAIRCVEHASPFPPFPDGVNKEEESYRIVLEYK